MVVKAFVLCKRSCGASNGMAIPPAGMASAQFQKKSHARTIFGRVEIPLARTDRSRDPKLTCKTPNPKHNP